MPVQALMTLLSATSTTWTHTMQEISSPPSLCILEAVVRNVYKSPLSSHIGIESAIYSTPSEIKNRTCNHYNISSRHFWNCQLTKQVNSTSTTFITEQSTITFLECVDDAACPQDHECEDLYCIKSCSVYTNSARSCTEHRDCLLDMNNFQTHHSNHNISNTFKLAKTSNLNYRRLGVSPNNQSVVRCRKIDEYKRRWIARVGQVANKSCPLNGSGAVIWKCGKSGKFEGNPNYAGCSSAWVATVVRDSENVVNKESGLVFLTNLINDTMDSGKIPFVGTEIQQVSNAIEAVFKTVVADGNETLDELKTVVQKVIESSDNVLKSKQQWLQINQENRTTAATQLIDIIEKSSQFLGSLIPTNETQITIFKSSNSSTVVIGSFSQTADDANREDDRIIILDDGNKDIQLDVSNRQGNESLRYVYFTLDSKVVQYLLPGKSEEDTDDMEYSSLDDNRQIVNGKLKSVLVFFANKGSNDTGLNNSSNVNDSLNGNSTPLVNLTTHIEMTFHHEYSAWGVDTHSVRRRCNLQTEITAVLKSGKCVFLDVTNQKWSTKGCQTVKSSSTETVCRCNHLTSFAVLMDLHYCKGEDVILEGISIFLCSLSVMCLILTIIGYNFAKSFLSERAIITRNLAVYLVLGNLSLLLGFNRDLLQLNAWMCTFNGLAAHFVLIVALCWMGVEGIHLHNSLFSPGQPSVISEGLYHFIAVGISTTIVGATFSIGYWTEQEAYGNPAICWLNDHYKLAFNIPCGIIVLVNIVILGRTLNVAYNRGRARASLRSSLAQTGNRRSRKWMTGGLYLSTLLGITWGFGNFVLIPGIFGLIAAYIFTILNASQGIFIFTFYFIMDTDIRKYFAKVYRQYKQTPTTTVSLGEL